MHTSVSTTRAGSRKRELIGIPGSSHMAVNRRELTSEHFPATICAFKRVHTKNHIHEVSHEAEEPIDWKKRCTDSDHTDRNDQLLRLITSDPYDNRQNKA